MPTFDEESFEQAVRRFSPHVDLGGPLGYHQPTADGRIDVICSACIYVWVKDSRCVYVGQVRRASATGVAERFANHHRRLDDCDGVWLITMRPTVPKLLLDVYERALIHRYDPAYNRIGRRQMA